MSKSIQYTTIALIVSIAICTASPARLEKLKPSKSKFLSRQEVAEDVAAQTPYPPAGIKPEVAFNLPTEQRKLETPDNTYLPPVGAVESNEGVAQPAQTYGPPAQTYGVPKVSVKDEVEEIATEQPAAAEQQPDESQSAEGIPEVVSVSEDQPEQAEPSNASDEDEQENDIAEDDDAENEAELEAEEIEAEINRVEAEEGLINTLSERIVRVSSKNAARSRSAKLQVASPFAPQPILPQPIYLVNYNGQLYRLFN